MFIGDSSSLFITTRDGENDHDIFKYLSVSDNCEGAWQAYLLHTLWYYLPMYWHAGYNSRVMILTNDDLLGIANYFKHKSPKDYLSFDVKQFEVAPQVSKQSDGYIVSCCIWNAWRGLFKETVKITITDNKVSEIKNVSKKMLIKYNCRIVF